MLTSIRIGMMLARGSKARNSTSWSTPRLDVECHRHGRQCPGSQQRASLLGTLFGLYPFLLKLFADSSYQTEFRSSVKAVLSKVSVEIVKRSDRVKGFIVLPRRRVVERTLAWLNHSHHLSKDRRASTTGAAFLLMASIRLMVRRLCQSCTWSQTATV